MTGRWMAVWSLHPAPVTLSTLRRTEAVAGGGETGQVWELEGTLGGVGGRIGQGLSLGLRDQHPVQKEARWEGSSCPSRCPLVEAHCPFGARCSSGPRVTAVPGLAKAQTGATALHGRPPSAPAIKKKIKVSYQILGNILVTVFHCNWLPFNPMNFTFWHQSKAVEQGCCRLRTRALPLSNHTGNSGPPALDPFSSMRNQVVSSRGWAAGLH